MEQINLYLQSAIDFLAENVTIELAVKIIIGYFFVVWIALIVWVIKDISVRTNSMFFQIFCVLTILILTPF
jgi:type IV secretory pathway VirB3-like protein